MIDGKYHLSHLDRTEVKIEILKCPICILSLETIKYNCEFSEVCKILDETAAAPVGLT